MDYVVPVVILKPIWTFLSLECFASVTFIPRIEWSEIISEDSSFAIKFPTQPTMLNLTISNRFVTFDVRQYCSEGPEGLLFWASYSDLYIGPLDINDTQKALDKFVDIEARDSGGTIVDQTDISRDGHRRRQFIIALNDDHLLKGRTFVRGRIYEVAVHAPSRLINSGVVNEFLD